jgi:hypothetical protein
MPEKVSPALAFLPLLNSVSLARNAGIGFSPEPRIHPEFPINFIGVYLHVYVCYNRSYRAKFRFSVR